MRPENKAMMSFLKESNIQATPKYLKAGSLGGCWRLYAKGVRWDLGLAERLNALGFVNYDGKPLGLYSGNGGFFCVFVRIDKNKVKGLG